MKKHLLIYLIIYSICSLAGQVRAQERFADRYNITYVTMNEGLPHNFIQRQPGIYVDFDCRRRAFPL